MAHRGYWGPPISRSPVPPSLGSWHSSARRLQPHPHLWGGSDALLPLVSPSTGRVDLLSTHQLFNYSNNSWYKKWSCVKLNTWENVQLILIRSLTSSDQQREFDATEPIFSFHTKFLPEVTDSLWSCIYCTNTNKHSSPLISECILLHRPFSVPARCYSGLVGATLYTRTESKKHQSKHKFHTVH